MGDHPKPSATAYDVVMFTSIVLHEKFTRPRPRSRSPPGLLWLTWILTSGSRLRLGSRRPLLNPSSTTSAVARTRPCSFAVLSAEPCGSMSSRASLTIHLRGRRPGWPDVLSAFRHVVWPSSAPPDNDCWNMGQRWWPVLGFGELALLTQAESL